MNSRFELVYIHSGQLQVIENKIYSLQSARFVIWRFALGLS